MAVRHASAAVAWVLTLTLALPLAPAAAVAKDHPTEDVSASDAGLFPDEPEPDWHLSPDRVFHGHGDQDGYRISYGAETSRWAWRPLVTIQPDVAVEDDWLGYHCLTGDGSKLLVSMLPARAVNRHAMRDRGALVYSVDVATAAVSPVLTGAAFKYHTPGCGAGTDVALLRHLGTDQERTEVLMVDSRSGAVSWSAELPGQLVSAVPFANGSIAAVQGSRVVRVDRSGNLEELLATKGQPYMLRPLADGGLALLVAGFDDTVRAVVLSSGGQQQELYRGRLGSAKLFPALGGKAVLATPEVPAPHALIRSVLTGGKVPRAASMLGGLLLYDPPRQTRSSAPLLDSGQQGDPFTRSLPDGAEISSVELPEPVGTLPRSGSTDAIAPTVETDGAMTTQSAPTPTCAVPRNHLRRQVPQPNRQQIDWAIQQATRNALTGSHGRPTNFLNMQLAAYSPSSDFPRHQLRNTASAAVPIPPSVIQGTFAQESAWRHASPRALPGVSGNPLVGDYYGAGGTLWIDYAEADCGYGVGQVTSGMRAGDTSRYSVNGKTKIAVDYAENVQASIQFLVEKWNQLYDLGTTMNGADPKYLETWYGAAWAYNTGVNAPNAAGLKGLGWTNNPIQSDYPPDRQPFLRTTYADAAHPSDWPYQERVFGWMETPILNYEGNPSYAEPSRQLEIPHRTTFCTTHNQCSPTYDGPADADFCTRTDRQCWWSAPVTWASSCLSPCSESVFAYSTSDPEPAGDDNYPPACERDSAQLPSGAVIVDNQPDNLNVEGCAGSTWDSVGTFAVQYGQDAAGVPHGEIDWHQLGTGFGGHTWFTRNRASASDTEHINTGTWTPPSLSGLHTVHAHIPASGASTSVARYEIHHGDGTVTERVMDQHLHENRWVPLGAFQLTTGAKVVLTNLTPGVTEGSSNIAFDALAFVPTSGTPVSTTFEAVQIFKPEQDMDSGYPAWAIQSPVESMQDLYDWAKTLTTGSDQLQGGLPGESQRGFLDHPPCLNAPTAAACMPSNTWQAMLRWDRRVTEGGPNNSTYAPGKDTQAQWMSFSVPKPPAVVTPTFFDDLTIHKQRSRVEVDYYVSGGAVVPGSVHVTAKQESGHSHLPDFVLDFMRAVHDDYGVALPDLRYSAEDLTHYTHTFTDVNPFADNILPGRALRGYSAPPQAVGSCVRVNTISGGIIGLRPLSAEAGVIAEAKAWRDRVQALVQMGSAPDVVGQMAAEIYNLFFNEFSLLHAQGGSPFRAAPPIWMQQRFDACSDGSVRPVGGTIADSGYMPDLYLYVNGVLVDMQGQPAAGPAQSGDFARFTNAPNLSVESPWRMCDTDPLSMYFINRRDGSPWDFPTNPFDDDPGFIPESVRLCNEPLSSPRY